MSKLYELSQNVLALHECRQLVLTSLDSSGVLRLQSVDVEKIQNTTARLRERVDELERKVGADAKEYERLKSKYGNPESFNNDMLYAMLLVPVLALGDRIDDTKAFAAYDKRAIYDPKAASRMLLLMCRLLSNIIGCLLSSYLCAVNQRVRAAMLKRLPKMTKLIAGMVSRFRPMVR
jgi:hypothetical protein